MSNNANNNGPAPPYTGAPPSMAELMAEIHQMRGTINTLRARINEQPAANTQARSNERDLGEALKPPKPEPFTGRAADVIPFLTRMKAHFRLYKNKLDTATKKVLYTSSLIQGDAKDWFEPILRDFLENEDDENLQDQETQNIFTSWDNFEQALKDNFGVINEERQAAAELMALRQLKSCATYSTKFRQLAAKTEWDDEALMEIYYQGLKEEVKDELHKADRPDDLTTYFTMAIKIDQRQYERRKERANATRKGSNFNPYYPNRQNNNRNNHHGNSRNQGQRRGNQQNNTSYGTAPGPMVIGATQPAGKPQRDMSKCKCYNCNKYGHMARVCPEPRRPRDPNQGKQTLGATNEQEPQMALRTQTLGMCRSGYDVSDKNATNITWTPHPDSSIKQPRDNFLTKEEALAEKEPQPLTEQQEKKKQYQKEYRANPINQERARIRGQLRRKEAKEAKYGKTQTLGMMRTPKKTELVPIYDGCYDSDEDPLNDEGRRIVTYEEVPLGSEPTMARPPLGTPIQAPRLLSRSTNTAANQDQLQKMVNEQLDDIPTKTTIKEKENLVLQEREAEAQARARRHRNSRSMGHRGGAARSTAHYLRKEDERLENKWKQTYQPLYDESGIRMFNSPEDMYIQGAREHEDTKKAENIHIRAYHMAEAMNPHHKEPKFDTRDDIRTLPTNPGHDEISWASCRYHWCKLHFEDKKDNDCFPVTIPGTPNDKPYLPEEIMGYLVHSWYETLGIAELRFNLAYYRSQQKDQETAKAIRQSMQIIEEANQEFRELTKGKYDHLMKSSNDEEDEESEDTDELDCVWEADGLHLTSIYDKMQQPDESTEETAETQKIFEPIDLGEAFEQIELSKEDTGNDYQDCNDDKCERHSRTDSGKDMRLL
jgi:hypothetical protein